MQVRPITKDYAVYGQITLEDLSVIQEAGFRSIVCHRPDGEQPDQPTFESIKAKATELGIEMRHIPIGPNGVTEDAVRNMVDALDEMDMPMLGYCRSGARSTAVFQQTEHLRG